MTIPGGGYIVSIGVMLFAFSTILGWQYYGERCLEFIRPKAIMVHRIYGYPIIIEL